MGRLAGRLQYGGRAARARDLWPGACWSGVRALCGIPRTSFASSRTSSNKEQESGACRLGRTGNRGVRACVRPHNSASMPVAPRYWYSASVGTEMGDGISGCILYVWGGRQRIAS